MRLVPVVVDLQGDAGCKIVGTAVAESWIDERMESVCCLRREVSRDAS